MRPLSTWSSPTTRGNETFIADNHGPAAVDRGEHLDLKLTSKTATIDDVSTPAMIVPQATMGPSDRDNFYKASTTSSPSLPTQGWIRPGTTWLSRTTDLSDRAQGYPPGGV